MGLGTGIGIAIIAIGSVMPSNRTPLEVQGGPFASRRVLEQLLLEQLGQQFQEQSQPLRPEQRAGRLGGLAQESKLAGLRSGLERERADTEPEPLRQAKEAAMALPLNVRNLQKLEAAQGPIRRQQLAEETGEAQILERGKMEGLTRLEEIRGKTSKEIAEIQSGSKQALQTQKEQAQLAREAHTRQLQDIANLIKTEKSSTVKAQLMQRYFDLAQQGPPRGDTGTGTGAPLVTGEVIPPEQRQEIISMLQSRGIAPTEENIAIAGRQLLGSGR